MIYLASGIVCLCIAAAYTVGMIRGYTKGYDHAIEDIEQFSLIIKKEAEKRQKNEE